MRNVVLLLLTLSSALFADLREEALKLAHEAGQKIQSDPATSSDLAAQAYKKLSESPKPVPADLAACAGLAARSNRLAGFHDQAETWFRTTLTHAAPPGSIVIRAELADMLTRRGELQKAREALGPSIQLPRPSPPLAQWHQTSAKHHLACGLPKKAKASIALAIAALPPDDTANHVALAIDAAGIALRLEEPIADLINHARKKLLTLEQPKPELLSALVSIASQAPDLTPAESLSILQSFDPVNLPEDARATFAITLAETAMRAGEKQIARRSLDHALAKNVLPDDHPLLAKALALAGDPRSAEVSLRWLQQSDVDDSEILLGLQRTVDPYSVLVKHAPEKLALTYYQAQNLALRKRLDGEHLLHPGQAVCYLLYQQNFTDHYGAIIRKGFSRQERFVPLGPAEKIHQRIRDTIETAERTLGEAATGSRLHVRLTQLHKSIWAPLAKHLDHTQRIDIVPTGMLHAVPWAILRQRDGRYLCQLADEVRILSVLGKFPEIECSDSFLAIGTSNAPGPIVTEDSFPFDKALTQLITSLPALPGVKAELTALAPLGQTKENPTRNEFLKLLESKPGTLHLAGHGFVIESEQGHGFRSGLILHGGGKENLLFAREIADLNFHSTELVVLSACRGGIGQSQVGGNWSSLRRSFIAAGAKNVLAAQWRIRDDQLAPFMTRFHELRKTHSPSKALWLLQRQWLQKNGDLPLATAGAWVLETR